MQQSEGKHRREHAEYVVADDSDIIDDDSSSSDTNEKQRKFVVYKLISQCAVVICS